MPAFHKLIFYGFCTVILFASCRKDSTAVDTNKAVIKTVLYYVKGTNFTVSYIDSNSIFRANQVFKDSFRYQFKKGSGAEIGISIHKQASSDTIFEWNLIINNALFANAFSEGGVYLYVPYD